MISKAKPSPPKSDLPQTWLLYGDDPRFFREPAAEWIARWGGEEGAISISAPGLAPPAFHTEVNSLPFLKERQVVRLTHLEGASPDLLEAVAAYGKDPSPTTALLLEFAGEKPRPKKGAPNRADLALASLFESLPHRECKPRSVAAHIRERLAAAGFRADPGAVEAIEEWATRDAGKAAGALDLLLLYRAQERRISEGDVSALLGAGGSPTRWQLADAFLARDARPFRRLLAEVERDPEVQREPQAVAIAFVGILAKQVRALLVVRGMSDSGSDRKAILQALAQEPLKMVPFSAEKICQAVPSWSEAQVRRALATLFELDLALKGGAEPAPPWTLLERYLSPLVGGCPAGEASPLRDGRKRPRE